MRFSMHHLTLATLALAAMLSGCVVAPLPPDYPAYPGYRQPVETTVVIDPLFVPPPVRVEIIPPAPVVGYVWIRGAWVWESGRHVWHPGRWLPPEHGLGHHPEPGREHPPEHRPGPYPGHE